MKPPWAYREARHRAPIHVQLLMKNPGAQPRENESVPIVARIVRIFRDDTRRLWMGKRVRFFVPVAGSNPTRQAPLDGTIYHHWSNLTASRWFEAFLCVESDGALELVESQIAAIRWPTVRPVCNPDDEAFLFAGNAIRCTDRSEA